MRTLIHSFAAGALAGGLFFLASLLTRDGQAILAALLGLGALGAFAAMIVPLCEQAGHRRLESRAVPIPVHVSVSRAIRRLQLPNM